jgi:uncharacterized protein (TIGR04255 family)
VLGVQFAPIEGFTSGHFGWYWKNFLDESWVRTREATLLLDQFEKFGAEEDWKLLGLPAHLQLRAKTVGPYRLQIINVNDDRMIQIQNTRFHYNWKGGKGSYPGFERVFPEFLTELDRFRAFLRHAGLGEIAPNQWEVTYVNHVPKGHLWQTPADWHTIFPALFARQTELGAVRFEGVSGEWHYEIPPRRGRVHASVQHARAGSHDNEVLALNLTARGPIGSGPSSGDVTAGLRSGHEAAVRTFVAIASKTALDHWGQE